MAMVSIYRRQISAFNICPRQFMAINLQGKEHHTLSSLGMVGNCLICVPCYVSLEKIRRVPACDVEGVRWFGIGPVTISGREAAKSVLILRSKRIRIDPQAVQARHRAGS